ncbi:uncharacterized protein LOC129739224 isoform X2 [Uranotaenia lowii]|uniref:uncharacterized protein LOC129739224 isoform X2 n=1 Tax=Uranotaenia lowii TaxID=190385 RepID=UPI00247991FD|nr:uncharacterized protein LOC129739224 isoform X2 [Uranotaenia lowii]
MAGDDVVDDILRPLSQEDLILLKEIYRKHLPESIPFFFVMENQLRWLTKMEQMEADEMSKLSARAFLRYYVPRNGKLENGTFVAITDNEDPCVYFHSLQEDCNQLIIYLSETKLICWRSCPVFCGISDNHFRVLEQVINQKMGKLTVLSDCSYFTLDKNIAAQFEFNVPDDVVLKEIDTSYAEFMNEHWPHRYLHSSKYIRFLIQFNGGLGLFDKSTGDLIGWVLKNEFAGVGLGYYFRLLLAAKG